MAIQINIPSPSNGKQDVQNVIKTSTIVSDPEDVTSLVNLVNKYLWFSLWVVWMVVLVIAWYKLLMARWDEKEMKKATNIFAALIIWVLIAIFSYLLVRLSANIL